MRRVLIGPCGGVLRAGLGELIREGGCELVAEELGDDALLERLVHVLSDVVMLDLASERGLQLAQAITADFPSVKVVALSSDEQFMQVYPPFHRGESYKVALSQERLVETIARV